MEGRADYSSLLERERLYSGLGLGLGAVFGHGDGAAGLAAASSAALMHQQLSELARASTPLPPDPLAALHARYLPHALPLHASHPSRQPSAYSPYFPLLSPTESLSLFPSHSLASREHYHRIYDLQKESLLAAGSHPYRHGSPPGEGSTHTSTAHGSSSSALNSSRQASGDVKHNLGNSVPRTAYRSLSRDARKSGDKNAEPRSKSETRRERSSLPDAYLDTSRDRPCDLRINTGASFEARKRHSVTEILRTQDKADLRNKRCESVPIQLRSPEPGSSSSFRSRTTKTSSQGSPREEPIIPTPKTGGHDSNRTIVSEDTNESRTKSESRVDYKGEQGGKLDVTSPPSSRTECGATGGSQAAPLVISCSSSNSSTHSDKTPLPSSIHRSTGVTLYSKRKPNAEGKSGDSTDHVDVGSYLVPNQQAVIAISRSPNAIGRGSPQEGGKVHATTFTPQVGTIAGWPSPPSHRKSLESTPTKTPTTPEKSNSTKSGIRTSTETPKLDTSPVIRQHLASPPLHGVVVKTRSSPEGTTAEESSPKPLEITVKTNLSPVSSSKDTLVAVKTNLDSPEGESLKSRHKSTESYEPHKVKVKSSLSPVIPQSASKEAASFGTQPIKVESLSSCDKDVKLENGSAASKGVCLKQSPESANERSVRSTGRDVSDDEEDGALNLSTSTRHKKCSSVDKDLVQPKKEQPSPCKRTRSNTSTRSHSQSGKETESPSRSNSSGPSTGPLPLPAWPAGLPGGPPLLSLPGGLILPYDPSMLHTGELQHKRLLGTGWLPSSLRERGAYHDNLSTRDSSRVKLEHENSELHNLDTKPGPGLLTIPAPMVGPGGQVITVPLPIATASGPGVGAATLRLRDTKEEPSTPAASAIPVGIAIARQREERSDEITGTPARETTEAKLPRRDGDAKVEAADSRDGIEAVPRDPSPPITTDQREQRAAPLTAAGLPLTQGAFPDGPRDGAPVAAPGVAGPWVGGAAPAAALGAAPAMWMPSAATQPVATAIPVDPSHIPLRPPAGYKLAQDSLSGHLYFVPEAVLDSNRWPTSSNNQPVVLGQPHIAIPPPPAPAPAVSPQETSQPAKHSTSPPAAVEVGSKWQEPPESALATDLKQEAATPVSKQLPWPPKPRIQAPWQQTMAVVTPQREGLLKSLNLNTGPSVPKATVAPQQHRKQSPDSPGSPDPSLRQQSSQVVDGPVTANVSQTTTSTRTSSSQISTEMALPTEPAAEGETSRPIQPTTLTPGQAGLPVTTPHGFPLMYPSPVPYICDPSLLRGLPFNHPVSTTDRGTSPIIFPDETKTQCSSTTTDDLSSICSTAVQTTKKELATQEQGIQTAPMEPAPCPACQARAPASPRPKGVADYLFDLSGPMLSQIEAEEDSKLTDAASQPQSPSSSSESMVHTEEEQKPRDLLSLIPQVSQVSDGLELLSILAEHAQKEQMGNKATIQDSKTGETKDDDEDGRDINRNYNAPKASMMADIKPISKTSKMEKQEVFEEYMQGGFRITAAGIEGMDALELEMRMRLAELQRRYKEKQKELSRLQPRKESESAVSGQRRKRTGSKASSRSDRSRSPRSDSTDSEVQTAIEPSSKVKKVAKKEEKPKASADTEQSPEASRSAEDVDSTPKPTATPKSANKKKPNSKPDVTPTTPVETPPPAKLRASPSIAQQARQSLINNPLAGQIAGKTIKSTSSARTTALNFNKSPFGKSTFGKSPSALKSVSPSKPKTIFKSQSVTASKTPNKSEGNTPGKVTPKFFGSSKVKVESPSTGKAQNKPDKPLCGLALLAQCHKKKGVTTATLNKSPSQNKSPSLSTSSSSSSLAGDKSKPGTSTMKAGTIASQTKLSSGTPIPIKTYGGASSQMPLKTYSSPASQTKASSRGSSPSKKPTAASASKKTEVKKEEKGTSDDSGSESEELEDVSWLFDEDEINPPGMSDSDMKSLKTEGSTVEETWSMSSPHSSAYDSMSESGVSVLSKYGREEVEVMKTSVAAATSAALKSKKRKKSPDDTGMDDSEFYDNPVKRRKPGRPKKLGEEQSARGTETIVAKKPKYQKMPPTQTDDKTESKTPKKPKMKPTKKETQKEKDHAQFLEEEWNIRRSERIFLNDPNLHSPTATDAPSSVGSSTSATSKPKSKPKSEAKVTQDTCEKEKKKPSKGSSTSTPTSTATNEPSSNDNASTGSKDCPYRYPSSSSDSSDSESSSDGDNVPLSTLKERETTPEPRSCVLDKDELKDGLRVLMYMDGLFYEGQVKGIQPPDVYGVVIDGERGSRPHIMSREELLKEAILDVRPLSARFLSEGARVCAYWSQQFSCLYPGTISKDTGSADDPQQMVVEFDDGDSGRIPVEHIRMLPADYPIVDVDPTPLLIMGGKRKRRTTADDLPSEVKDRRLSLPDTFSLPSKVTKKRSSVDCSPSSSAKKRSISEERHGPHKPNLPPISEAHTKTSKNISTEKLHESSPDKTIHQDENKTKSKSEDQTPVKKSKDKKVTTPTTPCDKTSQSNKDEGKSKSNLAPLTIDTHSGSPPAVTSTKSSPGSASTYSISPGSQAGLTMRIRTNSVEGGPEPIRMEDSESSSEGSEQSSSGNNSDSSSVDGDSASSSSLSDAEDNTGDGDKDKSTGGAKQSTDKPTTETKKGSPASSGGSPGNKPKQRKERNLSGEKSKIAVSPALLTKRQPRTRTAKNNTNASKQSTAFLPARQIWRWSGKGTKRPGMKGKAKKEYFKAIQRGKEMIRVGECAVFLSTGRPHLPYVGRLESLWEGWGGNMVVKVKWFYHPEETKGGKRLAEVKGALYESPHEDENDVQTISHKCEVASYTQYKARKKTAEMDNNDLYYLAGTYEPTIGMITFQQDVKVL